MRVADPTRSWFGRWWLGQEKGAIGSLLGVALAPAEGIFRGAVWARTQAFDRGAFSRAQAPIPVISVGNLTVGGTGKTPFCAWIAGRLAAMGQRPAVVLRGYGRDEVAVHRTLNPEVPVVTARRRLVGVRRAALEDATCAVLDDGFQHRRLARDLDIVLVSADSWSSAVRMLPRGPFREPLSALRRADQVFVTRKSVALARAKEVADDLRSRGVAAPIGVVFLEAERLEKIGGDGRALPLEALSGRRVLAISSLADPAPFLERLRALHMRVDPFPFPDHHDFDSRDRDAIVERAGGDPVVMTLKEAVKLREGWPANVDGLVLRQRVILEEGLATLQALLIRAIGGG